MSDVMPLQKYVTTWSMSDTGVDSQERWEDISYVCVRVCVRECVWVCYCVCLEWERDRGRGIEMIKTKHI